MEICCQLHASATLQILSTGRHQGSSKCGSILLSLDGLPAPTLTNSIQNGTNYEDL
jgi:hypothetical protein